VALSVGAGVMVVGWLLVTGGGVLSRAQLRRSAESRSSVLEAGDAREWISRDHAAHERRARKIPGEPGETNEEPRHEVSQAGGATGEAEAILAKAKLKAAEILADAQRERERLLEECLASAEGAALEIRDKAEREAQAIVKNGELIAREALTGVERERGRLEQQMQEVAREQALMAVKQKRLSEFLLTVLEEIERASANGSANIAGLQELREKLRSTE
jgi:vacuolar-type H+-ATPase subunit H